MQDFGKNIGIRCLIEQIEQADENGSTKVIDYYFKPGENEGKSKGLVELCKDLGVPEMQPVGFFLDRYRYRSEQVRPGRTGQSTGMSY